MPQNTHLEIVREEAERMPEVAQPELSTKALQAKALAAASTLSWLPGENSSDTFRLRSKAVARDLKPLFVALASDHPTPPVPDDVNWLYDNARMLASELQSMSQELRRQKHLPHVRNQQGEVEPRVLGVAQAFLDATGDQFNDRELAEFIKTFQQTTVLDLVELWALAPSMKLLLLERIAERARPFLEHANQEPTGAGICVRSMRDIAQTSWKEVIEPLIVFDKVLREDPAGIYQEMDFDSRDLYRDKLYRIARYSECTEVETAKVAIALATEARDRTYKDPRIRERESHVGYYLLDKGVYSLHRRVSFRPPFIERTRILARRHPESYLLGVEIGTLALILCVAWILYKPFPSAELWLLAMVLLLLPCSQSAIQMMNTFVTALLTPDILPKLDFSEGVPADCVTLVAVPCLLLNERQVRNLVDDLEVRFLGNHDVNVHFALLTDLPETREPAREDSPLITLCGELIQELNEKYASRGRGQFFVLHRHRTYNPGEKMWMGWERKRGKLLDLNKLLSGQSDPFPVKVGDLSILPQVRFVLTLDSDTELPRGTARRMIGTLAHPLNQAIIDPETNTVVAGYGILQPRVGVSVQSTARSRMAAIYAGETGFDIYTRAVSDAYQDLFGEGSFTGKGIYEVAALHAVLDRRFPKNALLSHDLIEGAYARAGLVSDIEVIEDYPSHYSAYNRRKHRWLRGDWQIASWMFPRVAEESGDLTANPISLISRWKIFDNLRRSLVEPGTFLLLIVGWLFLNGPLAWTLATIGILLVPHFVQLIYGLIRAAVMRNPVSFRDAGTNFVTGVVNLFFTFTFLAHQTLLSLDAVVRALVRRAVTHRRLLDWETAAEVEMGGRGRTPVDVYLNWMPILAFGLALLVLTFRPAALPAALPVLILWGSSKLIASWLNQPPIAPRKRAHPSDIVFLRRSALQTWRYFAELSTAEHHDLVPDNVQEQPPAVAARVSPTNVGLLLNSRQAATEFGFLTIPEFVRDTRKTLATLASLPKHRGHMLNWYDTRTLQPLAPMFVSSVDSGNLLASLWTLQQGCLDQLRQPMLRRSLLEGLLDHLRGLRAVRVLPRKLVSHCEAQLETDNWLHCAWEIPDEVLEKAQQSISQSKRAKESEWLVEAAKARLENLRTTVQDYVPWAAPKFSSLRSDRSFNLGVMDTISLERLPLFVDELANQLDLAIEATSSAERKTLCLALRSQLPDARANLVRLIGELRSTAAEAGKLADSMDFSFLLNRRRKLLSVGYDVTNKELHSACYDLLGTESRTAIFVAVAKEDIPQESWFLLGRAHTIAGGGPALLSWTGTMFEYLMPSLWMRTYPNTLLERSRSAAVRTQQAYGKRKGVPWGISESAHLKLDEAGNYQYHAFGLANLAQRKPELDNLVISPYSTFLSLNVDAEGALTNLRRMFRWGWFGKFGFYESADFGVPRRGFRRQRWQLVRCWMAHHQGMSLLALANFLNDSVVQRWFHGERRVQATELLLHEKPVSYVRQEVSYRRAAA